MTHLKKISIFIFIVFLINILSQEAYAINSKTITNIDLVGEAAILIEKETEKVLYEKNMNQKMYPASTTKIMTAIVALEYGELEEIVTVGSEIEGIPWYSNKANLVVGDELSLHHLLYGLLLPSGNDAANTIAVHISKKITDNPNLTLQEAHVIFSELMNKKTKEIGADNTNFKNPHGFHHEEQYTTSWDMAMIGKSAMEHEVFREIVSTQEANFYNEEIWENTNYLIREEDENYYPYTTGIKTGNTLASGKCLVSSATKDNLDLIAVVLKSTDDDIWDDTITLLSYGFDNYEKYYLTNEGERVLTIELIDEESNSLSNLGIIAKSTLETFVNINEIGDIREEITWNNIYFNESPVDHYLNISHIPSTIHKGAELGSVRYFLGDEIIGESLLIAGNEVVIEVEEIDSTPWALIYGIIIIVVLIIVFIIRNRLRNKIKSKDYI